MKKFLSLAPLALVVLLVGCDDGQVSYGARYRVGEISYGNDYNDRWDYRDHMRRRQRDWRDHNDRHFGGRPGWNHGRGRGDWRDGNRWDRRNGDGFGRGWDGGLGRLTPVASLSPALTQKDVAAYATIGKKFGLGPKASTRILETLNRAAVGDFGGLSDLGLNAASLKAAKRNNGRLAASELDSVSRKLGVSSQKADNLIQAVLGK